MKKPISLKHSGHSENSLNDNLDQNNIKHLFIVVGVHGESDSCFIEAQCNNKDIAKDMLEAVENSFEACHEEVFFFLLDTSDDIITEVDLCSYIFDVEKDF